MTEVLLRRPSPLVSASRENPNTPESHRLRCLLSECGRDQSLYDKVAEIYESLVREGVGIDPSPMTLSDNAMTIVTKRYLLKDVHTGAPIETPNDMCVRVANKLASNALNYISEEDVRARTERQIAERIYARFKLYYEALRSISVVPAGRTLANSDFSVPNCVVLHIQDNLDDIMLTMRDAALLQQKGSGIGFPMHLMRPTGAVTVTSGGSSSGPISFLRVYNAAFGTIKQQNRHAASLMTGANMSIMKVTHPDILEFIHCKATEGSIKNFNISVGLTEEFMKQVVEDCKSPWVPTFNGKEWPLRRITRDQDGTATKIENVVMTAPEVFREIVTAAWSNGEPGCVFLDRVNEDNPLPSLGPIEASNPCGEQFLHDGDVCNLGAINASKLVNSDGDLDEALLRDHVRTGVMMLDDVVDSFKLPVKKVSDRARETRRVGLGLFGWADYLVARGIPYDSEENLAEIRRFMGIFKETAIDTSRELAKERGVFPLWSESVYAKSGDRRRNAFLSSLAPTGTTSMIADMSGGVEPHFKVAYIKKNVLGGMELRYVNPQLLGHLEFSGHASDKALMDEILAKGTVHQLAGRLPEHIIRIFRTAEAISPEWHVRVQAEFQKYVDNAISKTCNFPETATVQDVIDAYVQAWKLRCKGLTVYRSNSRQYQVLESLEEADRKRKKASGTAEPMEGVISKVLHGHHQLAESADSTNKSDAVRRFRPEGGAAKFSRCPICETADNLVHTEGCAKCVGCGWSAC